MLQLYRLFAIISWDLLLNFGFTEQIKYVAEAVEEHANLVYYFISRVVSIYA